MDEENKIELCAETLIKKIARDLKKNLKYFDYYENNCFYHTLTENVEKFSIFNNAKNDYNIETGCQGKDLIFSLKPINHSFNKKAKSVQKSISKTLYDFLGEDYFFNCFYYVYDNGEIKNPKAILEVKLTPKEKTGYTKTILVDLVMIDHGIAYVTSKAYVGKDYEFHEFEEENFYNSEKDFSGFEEKEFSVSEIL